MRLLAEPCPNAANRFSSVRVLVLPCRAVLPPAVRRCVPASAVDHIRHVPVHLECVLRLEVVPVLELLRRQPVSVRKDVLDGPANVMFRVA